MAVEQIRRLYETMPARLATARQRRWRGLTLPEKIFVIMTEEPLGWCHAGSAQNALK